jgi:2-dehydropantoate 2-reductase
LEIRTVAIVGLGALGVLFGRQLSKELPEGSVCVVADRARIERYEREGVYSNGEKCRFRYVTPEEVGESADLVLFAVKFSDLSSAIEAARNQVGPDTVILSLLNGVVSEEIIGRVLGPEKVLPAVAQGMDAVKVGNRLIYTHMGMICFGDRPGGGASDQVEAVSRFFAKTGIPHEVADDMRHRLWGKFMLNVGVNQAVAVFEGDYGTVQREGPARDAMIAAMREALALSRAEGVDLTEEDLAYWLKVLSTLNPGGKPSMRQDLEAGRYSEVVLFAGTVLELGAKHGIDCPVNRMLYDRIKEIENRF